MTIRLRLTNDEHRIYNVWFERITSQCNQKQALAQFLTLSGLPNQQLAYIWSSSELKQADLTEERFHLCMRMVALVQQGYTPTHDTVQSLQSLSMPFFGYEVLPIAPDGDPIWEISAQDRDYYVQGHRQLSRGADALPLAQASALFARSGLPEAIINRILLVTDIGLDNRLDETQFIVAMHLIKLLRSYKTNVPSELPLSLMSSIQSSTNVVSSIPGSPVVYCPEPFSNPVEKSSEALQLTNHFESSRAEVWRYCKLTLSDTDALHIAKLLFRDDHRHVCTLEFNQVEMSINGVAAFAKMLTHNTGLTALLLEHVLVSDGGGSLSMLISSLTCNQTIRRLQFDACNISGADIRVLCGVLDGKTSLTEISLLNNPLSLQSISCLKQISERSQINFKYSHNSLDSQQIVPGRQSSGSLSQGDAASASPLLAVIPKLRPAVPHATAASVPSTYSPKSISGKHLESLFMQTGDLMKAFALKLSFNIVSSTGLPQPSPAEELRFMRLQIEGRIVTCLLTILTIESVRTKMIEELEDLSKNISRLILELLKSLTSSNLPSVVSPDIFIRFKLLHAQYYFHTHRSLFSFYRTLHLILCSFWLNCLLDEQEASFKIEEAYHYELTSKTLESVKKMASLSPPGGNWIYSVSEEVSRRLCFRYENQIRLLDASNSIRLAISALFRIAAVLGTDFEVKSLKQTIGHILAQIGNAEIKSKLANKTHLTIQKSNTKWIAESVFTRAALAVIPDGSDCDRWMLDDDNFNLWTDKRSFQPEKYGYRICSLSELSKAQGQHHMIQLASPPVSRWLSHHEEIRSERQPFLSQIDGLPSFLDGGTDARPMDNAETQSEAKPGLRTRFLRMLGRKSSESSSNPVSSQEVVGN